MAHERKSFTITWKVEDVAFWLYDPTENPPELLSPAFTVNAMIGIRCKLERVPETHFQDANVALSLIRETGDVGAEEAVLDFELSFVGGDGSCLISREFTKIAFSKGTASPPLMVPRYEVFGLLKDLVLSRDTLIVRCRVLNIEDSESEECFARTRLEFHRKIFEAVLEDFSALKPDERAFFQIRSKSDPNPPFSLSTLSHSGGIDITLNAFDEVVDRTCICRLSLLNSSGNREKYGGERMHWRGRCFDGPVFSNLPKKKLTDDNKLYLPNDTLTLELEMSFPTEITLKEELEMIFPTEITSEEE